MNRHLIFTCEHGGNNVPKEYKLLFSKKQRILDTHRGYDPGALILAKALSKAFHAPLFYSTTTRLLVDLNRSITNKSLYSEITKNLSEADGDKLLNAYYYPYRSQVESFIKEQIDNKQAVLHLSIHTFTPLLGTIERKTDIGLLYDPKRQEEKTFCQQWRKEMSDDETTYRIRMNYPYKGNSDGLTTHLRSMYSENKYLGIELEVNQKYPLSQRDSWQHLQRIIIQGLKQAL